MAKKQTGVESPPKPKAKSSGITVKFTDTGKTVLSRWPSTPEEKADIEAKRNK